MAQKFFDQGRKKTFATQSPSKQTLIGACRRSASGHSRTLTLIQPRRRVLAEHGGHMIIREWRGRALREKSDAYPRHFRESVVPELRNVPGFLGAYLCQRQTGDRVEFLVLTRWQSMDVIRSFAGELVDKAVVEPGALAALVDYDSTVTHYVVIEEVSDTSPAD
jgi:heme-degrading monooxygenase HmoA